ncbi:plectin-like isoform X9 [Erythrolamprus reginae]|uniref:plectin-like isoform X9 n=1 Tax=Erythrolamprus reginae TaxID=121349 RepID=UPI00396C7AFA
MNASSYGYQSSDSFSNSTSTRTSIDSNENLVSVNCGPTLVNSCISFGNGAMEGSRLDMLQQIANRIQRDSLSCEDKLMLARNSTHSDRKRLEAGLQFQNEAEIAGYLLECENLLRQQVMDAQILTDGKYYQADQLVQRVAKLRDNLLALKAECSSIYNKGRILTTEQTKMMISGITQSLNSGFAPSLSPHLNSGLNQSLSPTLTSSSLTSGLSSGFSSRLTPSITPAYTPGFPPRLIQSYITGVDTGGLQTLKLTQIRKPLMKSAFIDQNLTEEEVNMKFVQDLLRWVDEMQVQLDRAEWGSDFPGVESHVENHKNVHKAIEEFESSLKEAKSSEIQMTAPLKLSYAEKLHKLESQYAKLLNASRNQERHLATLHNFVSRATRELIWLNEKEEAEVAHDWSERNINIARKKEYHADLMRELDQKEEVIKSVQEVAEQLLFENHPARLTIEAYRAAMQTQWSWILQLCQCVEQHLRENTAYFEFFNDAKEALDYLKNLRDAVHRKYNCDRSSSIHKLEDLIQESMEEKEQLLQYKSTVAGLVGRAKTIVQLKPRNPENSLKTSIPVKAICDYRQIEITIYKDDECVLASNSHRAKWKVISPSGNEAMVPSVCFTIPPPNKEAMDTANRIEQQYQNVLALWHESHINLKSVVSWHYLTTEIETVRASNVASIKTLLPGEHQQVLSNLQSRFDDFLEDSQESKIFSVADIAQLEREVNVCKQYYQELLKSAEREEHEESVYNLYISEVRNIRLRLENCEDRLIRQIRTPLERDDLPESVFRISEQEKLKKELDRLKDDLETITDKCNDFFSQAAGSPSVPTLRSELNLVIQNMNQVYSMSSIYIEKLKTVNLVLKNTQGAEALVKQYETKLCEEDPLTADKSNIENLMGTLKQWRSEVDEKREVFHALEDELQKAKAISDQMFKTHKERDLDFDWHKEKADQLTERWQNVHLQIENRLRDLEAINKSLKYYRDTYGALDNWIKQVEETQQKFQENPPQNSKALAKQLNEQKMLVSEIEMKQNKLDECQKYSEQYSTAVKDYELQTMTYRAMVDSQQKSPVKRRRMQSSSDFIIQEFMDLRTRYTALVTLMTQYIKFAGDSLKRLEEEETLKNKEALVRGEFSNLEEQQKAVLKENKKLMARISELEKALEEIRKQKLQLEVELPKAKEEAERELKKQQKKTEEICLQKAKAEQEVKRISMELEDVLKEKEAAEQELERVKQLTLKAEVQRNAVEENLRAFRIQLEESNMIRKTFEEHLRRKDTSLQDLEHQKKALMEELKKKTAEEEKLMKLIKEMERDLELQGSSVKNKFREKEITDIKRQITIIGRETCSDFFREKQDIKNIEEFQQIVDELTAANKRSERIIKDLKYELHELELQNASSEEKARLLKEKLDEANHSLRRLKIELDQKELVEQGYLEQLKDLDKQLQKATGKAEEVMQESMELKRMNMNYQEDLRSLQKEKAQLKRELEELTRTQTEMEIMAQQLRSQITSLQQEKMIAEQRTISCKGEASNLQEQFRKLQEQLLQKTREEKESLLTVQRLKDDLADSNHLVEKLKQKVEELTRWNSETKLIMTEVHTESERIVMERQIIDRKNDELKGLVDSFKEQLRVTNEELHRQIIIEQEHLDKIKRLEDELVGAKDVINEYKQKCDRDITYNMNTEMELRNLNTQVSTFAMEIKMNEQKIQQQQAHIQELNNKIKKLQDEFHQKTLDEQTARKKIALLQEESIKYKHSAEEFKKKFDKLLESHNIAENDISGIRMECITLQQEKHMAQENIRMYQIQIEDLQNRLQKCRDQLQQGKHGEMEHLQKYRKLEEEFHMQKRTMEHLKHQIDMQKREHGNQLRLFQNEINKKNVQLDFGLKGLDYGYLGDASLRDFEQRKVCTNTSPLLRRRQTEISSPGCKSEQLLAQKLQMVSTDSLPREKPFQMSGIAHSLGSGISQQSYSEYVSQTSTQFEVSIDNNKSPARLSEIDNLRDGQFLSSRHEESYEMGLGKQLHPMEIVNSKQYGVHAEASAYNQENGKTFGNEGRLLEGYRTSEGFRSEDVSKISTALEEKQAKEIPTEYDKIKFQGLREEVNARQLIEVKLLDLTTAEQLHSGKRAIAEVQKDLEIFLTKPTAVAGLYIEASKNKISFASAAKQRVIDKTSALALLESQVATGFIIDPITGKKFSVDESVISGLVDYDWKTRLLEAEKAVLGYLFSGKKLSVYQAVESRILERQKGKNIIEAQIATGGVIDPVRSVRIPPETAVELGLLNNTMLKYLHEPSSNRKSFENPNNRQAMYYKDLLKLCVLDVASKCFLLPVGERKISTPTSEKIHKVSVVDINTGAEMTSYEAYKKSLIDKSMYLELSGREFQWKESTCFDASGNSYFVLTDLKTGLQFNIDEALIAGKIDRVSVSKYKEGHLTASELGDILLTNSKPHTDLHSPIAGVWLPETNERMAIVRASRKNLVDRNTALRCLEAQTCTGGIIDPLTGKRYPVAEALQRELIDETCAKHLQQCELAFTGIKDPFSHSIFSVTEAINKNLLDKEVGTRCLEYQHLTGGLIDPKSHSRLSMEDAIKNGLIDAVTATKTQDDKFYIKSLMCPKTKKQLTYQEALQGAIFDCHTGLRLLEGSELMTSGISRLYYSTQ